MKPIIKKILTFTTAIVMIATTALTSVPVTAKAADNTITIKPVSVVTGTDVSASSLVLCKDGTEISNLSYLKFAQSESGDKYSDDITSVVAKKGTNKYTVIDSQDKQQLTVEITGTDKILGTANITHTHRGNCNSYGGCYTHQDYLYHWHCIDCRDGNSTGQSKPGPHGGEIWLWTIVYKCQETGYIRSYTDWGGEQPQTPWDQVAPNHDDYTTAHYSTTCGLSEGTSYGSINITQSNPEWTKDSVHVSADIVTNNNTIENAVSKTCVFKNASGNVLTNTDNNVVIDKNGTYTATVDSNSAYTSSALYTFSFKISNIDTTAPVIKDVKTTEEENVSANTVTVDATDFQPDGSQGSGDLSYTFDGGKTFQKSPSYNIKANGTYYIFVKDKAGNISTVNEITVDNIIDSTAPIIDNAVVTNVGAKNITVSTNLNTQVQIAVKAHDNRTKAENLMCKLQKYNADAKTFVDVEKDKWLPLTTPWVITGNQGNGMYGLIVKDEAGNLSTAGGVNLYTFDVEAWDNTPPTFTYKVSPDTSTASYRTITVIPDTEVASSTNIVNNEFTYLLSPTPLTDVPDKWGSNGFFTVSTPSTYYIYCRDKYGNYLSDTDAQYAGVVKESSLNIDNEPPIVETNISNPDDTSTVTVTIKMKDNKATSSDFVVNVSPSVDLSDKTQDGEWTVVTFKTSDPTDYDIKVSDAAGNTTETMISAGKVINQTLTVKFLNDDDTVLKTEQIVFNHAATAPEIPTKSGYTFNGWSCDFSKVSSDLTVYAKYTKNPDVYVTVHYNTDGGSIVKDAQVIKGGRAPYGTTVKKGYVLNGWYADAAKNNLYDYSGAVYKDITIYASWTLDKNNKLTDEELSKVIANAKKEALENSGAKEVKVIEVKKPVSKVKTTSSKKTVVVSVDGREDVDDSDMVAITFELSSGKTFSKKLASGTLIIVLDRNGQRLKNYTADKDMTIKLDDTADEDGIIGYNAWSKDDKYILEQTCIADDDVAKSSGPIGGINEITDDTGSSNSDKITTAEAVMIGLSSIGVAAGLFFLIILLKKKKKEDK